MVKAKQAPPEPIKPRKRELRVVEQNTRQVIHTIDVTGKSERQIEMIERGMLRQVNRDKFFLDDWTAPEEAT